jgi:hypothetical protein
MGVLIGLGGAGGSWLTFFVGAIIGVRILLMIWVD